jgi:exodeoxyribonuclease VII small subunit
MTTSDQPPSFEAMMSELDAVVNELEDGSLALETALARYERGVALLAACYERLRGAEQRIEQLAGVDENGRPRLQPFPADAAVAGDRPAARDQRKPAEVD